MVDEIGKAVGVTYQDDEPLIFDEKYDKRDDARWEDDPASSEDYEERQTAMKAESGRLRPRNNPRAVDGCGKRYPHGKHLLKKATGR